MPPLPVISGREAIRVCERDGWEHARTRGDHMMMIETGQRANLSIPAHKELDRGTLRKLISKAGLSVDEFISLHERKR